MSRSTWDRLDEAHWYIHQMQEWYHHSDPFRFSLSSFLRALKEVPQLIRMELGKKAGFKEASQPILNDLRQDALVQYLSKQRDLTVHHRMLIPTSSASIGVGRPGVLKLGMGMPINPREDSDSAMLRLAVFVLQHGDILHMLREDEDTAPCVYRRWQMDEFPEKDILDLAADAWRKVATAVSKIHEWATGESPAIDHSCLHSSNSVRLKLYDWEKLRAAAESLLAKQPSE